MKKWLLVVIIIMVIMTANETKKEANFSFRCNADDSAIELFDTVTEKATTYEVCDNGVCSELGGQVVCQTEESKKEEATSKTAPLFIAGAALLLIFNTRRKS